MPLAIKINPKDNVVVALHPIAKGTAVPVDGASVTAVEDIPQGHKMAIAPIHAGENVIKYGFPIGHATADAVPGTWMHTHNVKTNLSGEIEYSYHPNVHPLAPVAPETFMGYRRKDGRAATRNEIWIIRSAAPRPAMTTPRPANCWLRWPAIPTPVPCWCSPLAART